AATTGSLADEAKLARHSAPSPPTAGGDGAARLRAGAHRRGREAGPGTPGTGDRLHRPGPGRARGAGAARAARRPAAPATGRHDWWRGAGDAQPASPDAGGHEP